MALVEADPGSGGADLVRVSRFDCHPGYAQHSNGSKQHAVLHRIPPPLLLISEVEGQLGPTVGALDTGAAVKEGHIPRAAPP